MLIFLIGVLCGASVVSLLWLLSVGNRQDQLIRLKKDLQFKTNHIDSTSRCLHEKYMMIADLKEESAKKNIKINKLQSDRDYSRNACTKEIEDNLQLLRKIVLLDGRINRQCAALHNNAVKINDLTEQLHGCERCEEVREIMQDVEDTKYSGRLMTPEELRRIEESK